MLPSRIDQRCVSTLNFEQGMFVAAQYVPFHRLRMGNLAFSLPVRYSFGNVATTAALYNRMQA